MFIATYTGAFRKLIWNYICVAGYKEMMADEVLQFFLYELLVLPTLGIVLFAHLTMCSI